MHTLFFMLRPERRKKYDKLLSIVSQNTMSTEIRSVCSVLKGHSVITSHIYTDGGGKLVQISCDKGFSVLKT